jgi:hypothetical protein
MENELTDNPKATMQDISERTDEAIIIVFHDPNEFII